MRSRYATREGGRVGQYRVYKSNMLIEAYYDKLKLVEQRVFNLVIARQSPYEEVPEVITLVAKDYGDIFEIPRSEVYKALKHASERLHERTLEINGQEISWLKESVRYLEGEAKIEIRFSEEIKPHLCHFTGNFTSYDLQRVAALQSTHSIRLYELFRQQVDTKTGKGKLYITPDKLRRCLGLEGRYKQFRNLKHWVIKPAIEELEAKSGLTIQWTVDRRSRGPHSLTFVFEEKDIPKLVRFPSAEERERRAAESE
ncbi:MAG: replication initiation protein [Candidatus Thiodiazotropha sp.]